MPLIITGPQGSGKTLLSEWLHNSITTPVLDNVSKDGIIGFMDKYPHLKRTVFITNDRCTYQEFPREEGYLIIRLDAVDHG